MKQNSAFSDSRSECSRRAFVRVLPPKLHTIAVVTGGLKRLFSRIKEGQQPIKHVEKEFTDHNGRFQPPEGTLLAGRYRVADIICGRGQSAILIRAHDILQGDVTVVVKALHDKDSYFDVGFQEAHTLRRLSCADPFGYSHTVRLLNTFLYDKHFCLVFEALDPKPITHVLASLHLSHDQLLRALRKVTLQLLQVLGFLRQNNTIHADLKPENILLHSVRDLSSLRVIDFGNAINHVHREMSLYYKDFEVQTLLYRAPEVLFGIPFGAEIDMWSLGCVLAEIYLGEPLIHGHGKRAIIQSMVDVLGPLPRQVFCRGKFFDQLDKFTQKTPSGDHVTVRLLQRFQQRFQPDYAFTSFLAGLLTYDPDKRLTPTLAAQHPFLAPEMCLSYLLPGSDTQDYPLSTVLVSAEEYNMTPSIASEIRRQRPTSMDLLHIGTETTARSSAEATPKPSPSLSQRRSKPSPSPSQHSSRSSKMAVEKRSGYSTPSAHKSPDTTFHSGQAVENVVPEMLADSPVPSTGHEKSNSSERLSRSGSRGIAAESSEHKTLTFESPSVSSSHCRPSEDTRTYQYVSLEETSLPTMRMKTSASVRSSFEEQPSGLARSSFRESLRDNSTHQSSSCRNSQSRAEKVAGILDSLHEDSAALTSQEAVGSEFNHNSTSDLSNRQTQSLSQRFERSDVMPKYGDKVQQPAVVAHNDSHELYVTKQKRGVFSQGGTVSSPLLVGSAPPEHKRLNETYSVMDVDYSQVDKNAAPQSLPRSASTASSVIRHALPVTSQRTAHSHKGGTNTGDVYSFTGEQMTGSGDNDRSSSTRLEASLMSERSVIMDRNYSRLKNSSDCQEETCSSGIVSYTRSVQDNVSDPIYVRTDRHFKPFHASVSQSGTPEMSEFRRSRSLSYTQSEVFTTGAERLALGEEDRPVDTRKGQQMQYTALSSQTHGQDDYNPEEPFSVAHRDGSVELYSSAIRGREAVQQGVSLEEVSFESDSNENSNSPDLRGLISALVTETPCPSRPSSRQERRSSPVVFGDESDAESQLDVSHVVNATHQSNLTAVSTSAHRRPTKNTEDVRRRSGRKMRIRRSPRNAGYSSGKVSPREAKLRARDEFSKLKHDKFRVVQHLQYLSSISDKSPISNPDDRKAAVSSTRKIKRKPSSRTTGAEEKSKTKLRQALTGELKHSANCRKQFGASSPLVRKQLSFQNRSPRTRAPKRHHDSIWAGTVQAGYVQVKTEPESDSESDETSGGTQHHQLSPSPCKKHRKLGLKTQYNMPDGPSQETFSSPYQRRGKSRSRSRTAEETDAGQYAEVMTTSASSQDDLQEGASDDEDVVILL